MFEPVPQRRPLYSVPAGLLERTAMHEALTAAHAANQRLARGIAVVIAASVRDLLTAGHPEAPLDATHIELADEGNGSLYLTGTYWTGTGRQRTFHSTEGVENAEEARAALNEWAQCLDGRHSETWLPLVTARQLIDDGYVYCTYRLDLAKAAALSLD
ncbi:hypothetical protein ACFC0K_15970 [Streptomyces hydrogenans]|uniref:hypothetical protein n=1 Tax=Streptomyces hydrogenans TaxID=1873719 RepID=UPI0035D6FDEA